VPGDFVRAANVVGDGERFATEGRILSKLVADAAAVEVVENAKTSSNHGESSFDYTSGYPIALSGMAPLNSDNTVLATGTLPLAFQNFSLTNPANVNVLATQSSNSNVVPRINPFTRRADETTERPRVVLPENVRELLQQRLRFGRFGAGLMGPQ
jgi:hypothetical protein